MRKNVPSTLAALGTSCRKLRAVAAATVAVCAVLLFTQCTAPAAREPAAAAQPAPKAQAHGYMVANYTINDPATFQKYMTAAGPLAPKFNGKVILFDVKTRTLEGAPKSVLAIAEFPSVAEVERFYNSPEYTAARKFRLASTTGWVALAQGLGK